MLSLYVAFVVASHLAALAFAVWTTRAGGVPVAVLLHAFLIDVRGAHWRRGGGAAEHGPDASAWAMMGPLMRFRTLYDLSASLGHR